MKGFVYLVNDGAKKYVKEFGGNDRDIFPKRQRIMLAKDYVDEFEQIFKNQEYDFMKTEK
jgi:methenyltetrahydromethanopterin cyclohydrolase